MEVHVRLKEFLEQHELNPYALARNVRGEVSQTAVYALCRSEQVRRVDLHTLAGVIEGLRRLTGQEVGVADLLIIQQNEGLSPRVAALITAGPFNASALSTEPFDEDDDEFWEQERNLQRRLQERRGG